MFHLLLFRYLSALILGAITGAATWLLLALGRLDLLLLFFAAVAALVAMSQDLLQ